MDPATGPGRDPEIIIASWCGTKVSKKFIAGRPGWDQTTAVRRGHIFEIKSTYILQPGPAALTESSGITLIATALRATKRAGLLMEEK